MDFYKGKILKIDLTRGTSEVQPLNLDWARLYVGGKGLLLRYLWAEVEPGLDPQSPENPVLFVTGPFAGTNVSTSSRLVVGAKSPATGILNDSYVGGSFAPELKFAGYDMLIVTGKARQPSVACIRDGEVELRPAQPYWGMKTSEIEAAMRADFDPQAKVLSIGPAGENMVPWACISTDQFHKAGRGGLGALLGGKNLKAIVVRGTGRVNVGDARAFLAEMRRIHEESVLTVDNLWANEEGTLILVQPMNDAGVIPTRNWSAGRFEQAENLNSEAFINIRTKNRACYQCALGCRQFHELGGVKGEGPEYETIALCGANCCIGDIEALMRFNAGCDEFALDTISTGSVVALAMDMAEKDIADFGLRFGDIESYVNAPALIACREGVGAELALGARALAAKYGHPELAMEVKNLELPGYDPRGSFGMSLAYATSDRGGCHMRAYPIGPEIQSGTMPADSLEGKAAFVATSQDTTSIKFSGIWCDFYAVSPAQMAQMLRHIFHRQTSEGEVMKIGERIWNLGRLFNLREGVEPDAVPRHLLEDTLSYGACAGKRIGSEEFAHRMQEYYELRGWDEHGVPSEEKLRELGVDVRLGSGARGRA